MITHPEFKTPVGTRALIMSKLYFGVLSKSLEALHLDRYYSILYFLNENNGCKQQHICNNLAIDKTAMVKVIDTLMDAGYVEKKINPKDRREHFILLTRKGLKDAEKITRSFRVIEEKIFAAISKQERLVFNKVLHLLSASLRELPASDIFFNYKRNKKEPKKLTPSKVRTK